MISPDNDFDAWTSMPLEQDDEPSPALIAASQKKKAGAPALDIGGFLWKYVAAGSPHTSSSILACLATDGNAQIRRRVAENSNTGVEALELLADDGSGTIRASVAKNHNTPAFILRQLADDPDVEVRYSVACNPIMPDTILIGLFLDPDPYVADKASQTLSGK